LALANFLAVVGSVGIPIVALGSGARCQAFVLGSGFRESTVIAVLARELDGIASAHIEELSAALPGFAEAIAWPARLMKRLIRR